MAAFKLDDSLAGPLAASWQATADRFFDNALRWPDLPAVEARGQRMSYAQLAACVVAFTGRIRRRTNAPDKLVAVCLDRTVDLPAWLLAVHAAGSAYLPLDPDTPSARMADMLDDAAPALIIVSRCYADRIPPTTALVLVAEEDDAEDQEEEDFTVRLRGTIPPDAIAYVIYTSGSSGRPKGVSIEQGSLILLLEATAATLGLARGEIMLGLTRISFDLSVVELFLPLLVGGTLILADLDVAADPAVLADALERHRPDLVCATPATWRALIESGWEGRPDLRVTTGGEAITRDLANRLVSRCRSAWNMYGPTEATVCAASHLLALEDGPVPIGRPLAGATIRILNADLEEVADGLVGEIAISGHGVRRGYLNRPALTASRFVRLKDQTLTYLTGDLGKVGDDGLIYCLGRTDDQVKVHGFRIELGDVEAALAAHPAVAFSAVRALSDPAGDLALVAYVVRRTGTVATARDIKASLASLLPPYMIPARIEFIAYMPLTANGKSDRAALLNPYEITRVRTGGQTDSTVEAKLASLWCDLLGVGAVQPGDDFFDLGGYSLMTVRLLRGIEAEFGRRLTTIDLMRSSTLAGMASLVTRGSDGDQSRTMLLNDVGARAPLFWLDAGPLMRTMARCLPSSQPAFALNLDEADEAALDGNVVDIAAIAETLHAWLVAAQPTGPYYLGGWCRWGIVAYELACRLREEGRSVGLLVLLDAARPMPRHWTHKACARIKTWLSPPVRPPETRSFSQKVEAALLAFEPRSLDADVLLIRPAGSVADGGWRSHLGARLVAECTPGDHVSMVRPPHVATLASVIDRHLSAAQQRCMGKTYGSVADHLEVSLDA